MSIDRTYTSPLGAMAIMALLSRERLHAPDMFEQSMVVSRGELASDEPGSAIADTFEWHL